MKKILLVDDERKILEILDDIVAECCDFKVFFAENGEQALQMVSKETFDAVISDVNIPVMSGIELAKVLHRDYPKVKVALITGERYKRLAKGTIDELAQVSFLTKPIVDLEVESFVKRVAQLS